MAVKWYVGIEGRSLAGKTNHVNVKQAIGQLMEIAVGIEVVVRFNTK